MKFDLLPVRKHPLHPRHRYQIAARLLPAAEHDFAEQAMVLLDMDQARPSITASGNRCGRPTNDQLRRQLQ